MAPLAGPELACAIIPHLADEPGGFTQATANEYTRSGAAQELAEEVARTLPTKAQDDAFTASKDVVSAGVLDQLAAAGRFLPEVNQAYAAMVGNFFAVQAARLGITPADMAARYRIRITSESLAGAGLGQPTTTGFQWGMGHRKGLFGVDPLTVTELRGDEIGSIVGPTGKRLMTS